MIACAENIRFWHGALDDVARSCWFQPAAQMSLSRTRGHSLLEKLPATLRQTKGLLIAPSSFQCPGSGRPGQWVHETVSSFVDRWNQTCFIPAAPDRDHWAMAPHFARHLHASAPAVNVPRIDSPPEQFVPGNQGLEEAVRHSSDTIKEL